MSNKRILLINTHPFGTLTDTYKWCQYLHNQFDVTLICLDDRDHIEMNGLRIIRVKSSSSKVIRGCRFILCCLSHILFFRGIVLVVYFEHCLLLKQLLPWKKLHLDVRTLAVWGDQQTRDKYDASIRKAGLRFDSVSVVSEGVRDRLGIKGAWILPLGADIISDIPKNYSPLRLLYVGTFSYRHIEDTINGFSLFVLNHPDVDIHYDLIGDGSHGELEKCRALVEQLGLSKYVSFHGRINNNLLKPYFERACIGISYIPITAFYNIQPPTKTYEYALSGLFCIATATEENKKVISSSNGILIQDNAISFYEGLAFVYNHTNQINEEKVRNSLNHFTWDKIVNNVLIPQLCYPRIEANKY